LLAWLIFPKINEQFRALINNLPSYADQLTRNVAAWFTDYPDVSKQIREEGSNLSKWIPSVPTTLIRIGNFSLSILSTVLIIIVFMSMVVYAVTNPRPLVELYFSFFSPHQREKAKIALLNTSTMLIGWIRSNIIGGTIEAVCITIFLSALNVPGAWVWGALTFFAQFIPRIGFYIMAIPPILVSLSMSGATALWVTIFLLGLDEIMGDFVLPKVRSSTMNIHPVSLLFSLLAMGTAFGLIGILMATPLTAIIKAYYEEFYLTQFEDDKHMKERIDSIVYRNKPI